MKRQILLLGIPLLAIAADDDWPRWRGPLNNGMARGDVPVEFSETKSVAWKTAVPGRGHSSPVIWGNRIFVTTAAPNGEIPRPTGGPGPGAFGGEPKQRKGPPPGGFGGGEFKQRKGPGGPGGGMGGGTGAGVEHKFVLMCLDRNTGKVLWEQVAMVTAPHEGYHQRYGSFASNSPVTDGERVYAFFGSRGLYVYDLNGKLQWKKDFRPMKMRLGFGEGTATVVDGDTVLLNFDNEEDSYVVALDKRTGRELWRMSRDEQSAWAQPLVVTHNGARQAVVAASNKVRSYDLATGKLIWECAGLGSNVIPAPVTHNGLVYVMSGHRDPNLMAIKLGRTGDLTKTDAIVWSNQRGNSYTPSPVLHESKLYLVTDNGMVSALNASTGEPYYLQQRLPKAYSFKASPVGVNGKLYLSTENGDIVVLRMGEKFEVLATNSMGDQMFVASPAVSGNSLYLRGESNLYCIRN